MGPLSVFAERARGFAIFAGWPFWVSRRVFRIRNGQYSIEGRGKTGRQKRGVGAGYGVAARKMATPGSDKVPIFDGRGTSFLDFERQVHLWVRATKTEPAARESMLAPHMQPAPRQVCLAEGGEILDHCDGVARILEILQSKFAPEAADAINEQV